MKYFKRLCTTFIVAQLLSIGAVQADIREVYACNFLNGKGLPDMMKARDYYLNQAEKAGIETPDAYVWTPYKSSADFDLLWFNNHADLMAFGKQADAFNNSPEMASALERFNSVVSCKSTLATRETIYEGGSSPVTAPPAIISSSACMLREGIQAENVNDLKTHIKGVLETIPEYKNGLLFMSTPITSAANTPDAYLYGVHDSVSTWVESRVSFMKSEGGPMLGRHFQSVLDCTTSLWIGQKVVPKP